MSTLVMNLIFVLYYTIHVRIKKEKKGIIFGIRLICGFSPNSSLSAL